ncbi:prenyltransferase/squalene oxidase repeat-containing protein [Sphaerisporangium sp. NPDC005289]|uniref:prenyltransferase/squalene oxidase repeat-containing protein n=1 Tax=Sphaerisporangium sp. NPDC005289 TaxID=3155247 RepID=UPI0033B44B15
MSALLPPPGASDRTTPHVKGRAAMSRGGSANGYASPTAGDTPGNTAGHLAARAGALVRGLTERPWGEVTASVYETGRLVTLAPWLTGHAERVAFLTGAQRPDGSWGVHDDYALVPTLSATEALLADLRRGRTAGGATGGGPPTTTLDGEHGTPAAAAGRGLRALLRWSRGGYPGPRPDMPAVELIVPYLVEAMNGHLEALRAAGLAPSALIDGAASLSLPSGMRTDKLAGVRSALRAGAVLPDKLMHALEVAGDAAAGARGVPITPAGTVGASPAATAAWLGAGRAPEPGHPARVHLEAVARLHGGPVPCGMPITVFERGWVVSWLLRAGVPVAMPARVLRSLNEGLGPQGISAGAGLPGDADTTSVALYALALAGAPGEPSSLWGYRAGTHFATWQGEQGFSTTTNAHVLDCFREYATGRPDASPRYAAAVAEVAGWLLERQAADGSWSDRWHASPYYATMCCAVALDAAGGGRVERDRVRRAVRWVLSGQRADGAWGLWRGTAEETAYAMQTLLLCESAREEPGRDRAVASGHAYLLRAGEDEPCTPMWHDKDLYTPLAVVRAAIIGALHLAGRDATVAPHLKSAH